MAQTTFTVRMDTETKREFSELCANIGLTMSTAFSIFAKKAVSEQRIPFELTANDPFYTSENMGRLRRSAAQMEESGGTIHEIGELSR